MNLGNSQLSSYRNTYENCAGLCRTHKIHAIHQPGSRRIGIPLFRIAGTPWCCCTCCPGTPHPLQAHWTGGRCMSQFHLPSSMSCRSTLTMRSSEGSFSGVASTDGREISHGVGESPTASAFMEREQRKHVCGRLVEFPCAHHRCMCQQLPPYRHPS